MSERVAIFIDGSNFYHSLRHYYPHKIIDFQKLVKTLTGDRSLVRTYYYNATVLKEDGPKRHQDQQKFFDMIRRIPYFDVRLGRLVRKGTTVVEKGIDVRIAIDMLQMAHKNLYDTAILVSGDADYAHAVEAVKSDCNSGLSSSSLRTRSGICRSLLQTSGSREDSGPLD